MNEQEILRWFNEIGVVVKGHFGFNSGKHGDTYVNKDAVWPWLNLCAALARRFADHFGADQPQVTIGPMTGGALLARDVASALTTHGSNIVHPIFAEKKGDDFAILRNYGEFILDKRILVVEDVMTTGGSTIKVIKAVRELGGEIVGVAAIWNRGGVTVEMLGVPKIVSLVTLKLPDWPAADCPLCKAGEPINTKLGKK